jgi:hypothetical protein
VIAAAENFEDERGRLYNHAGHCLAWSLRARKPRTLLRFEKVRSVIGTARDVGGAAADRERAPYDYPLHCSDTAAAPGRRRDRARCRRCHIQRTPIPHAGCSSARLASARLPARIQNSVLARYS